MIILFFLISLLAFAQEAKAPRKPDAAQLAQYWKLVAEHHARNASFQQSLTVAQKQTLESIQNVDKEIEAQRGKMCHDGETLDENGAEPMCAVKPAQPAKP